MFSDDGASCVPVSDACAEFDEKGRCRECYKGYHLEDGSCVGGEMKMPDDDECRDYDWEKQVCLDCPEGWVFSY